MKIKRVDVAGVEKSVLFASNAAKALHKNTTWQFTSEYTPARSRSIATRATKISISCAISKSTWRFTRAKNRLHAKRAASRSPSRWVWGSMSGSTQARGRSRARFATRASRNSTASVVICSFIRLGSSTNAMRATSPTLMKSPSEFMRKHACLNQRIFKYFTQK